jgi:hypothetical protein
MPEYFYFVSPPAGRTNGGAALSTNQRAAITSARAPGRSALSLQASSQGTRRRAAAAIDLCPLGIWNELSFIYYSSRLFLSLSSPEPLSVSSDRSSSVLLSAECFICSWGGFCVVHGLVNFVAVWPLCGMLLYPICSEV